MSFNMFNKKLVPAVKRQRIHFTTFIVNLLLLTFTDYGKLSMLSVPNDCRTLEVVLRVPKKAFKR